MCNTSKLLLGLVLASSLSVASAKQKIIALQSLGIKPNQIGNTAPRLNFILDSLKQNSNIKRQHQISIYTWHLLLLMP